MPVDKPNLTIKNFPNHAPVIDGQSLDPTCVQKDKQCVQQCNNQGTTGAGCNTCKGSITGGGSNEGRNDTTKLCNAGIGQSSGHPCANVKMVAIKANNTTFDGFEVKNSPGHGVVVSGSSNPSRRISGVTVRNVNSHHHYGQGFQYWIAENGTVDNVQVWLTKSSYLINCIIGGNGFNFSNVRNTTINRVKVYYNAGEGLALDDVDGITLTNSEIRDNFHVNLHLHAARNLTIDSNVVYCSTNAPYPFQQRNIGIMMADEICASRGQYGRNRTITNNLIVGCNSGISLRHQRKVRDCDPDNPPGPTMMEGESKLEDDEIANNTVIGARQKIAQSENGDAEDDRSCKAYGFDGKSATNSVFANNAAFAENVCAQTLQGGLANAAGLTKASNIFLPQSQASQHFTNPQTVTLTGWPTGQFGASSGPGMIISNPAQITANHLVSNFNIANYYLKNTSSLINSGTNAYKAAKDMFGTVRPVGANTDIGIHEYTGANPPTPPPATPTPTDDPSEPTPTEDPADPTPSPTSTVKLPRFDNDQDTDWLDILLFIPRFTQQNRPKFDLNSNGFVDVFDFATSLIHFY